MERKQALIIWDDRYHPQETYREVVRKSLEETEKWVVRKTTRVRDLLTAEPKPELCIFFTLVCPEGEEGLTEEEQERMKKMAEDGMGMVFVHAGLTRIADHTPLFALTGGRFLRHPDKQEEVCCVKLPGCTHPVMEGFEAFSAMDEHYFCKVDIERVIPLMVSVSGAGTEIAGWAHTVGKGRICCLSPGHEKAMAEKMQGVIVRAAEWCAGWSERS